MLLHLGETVDESDLPVPSHCIQQPLKYKAYDLSNHTRDDLECPIITEDNYCKMAFRKICACKSRPKWTSHGPRPVDLFIEYVSRIGHARVFSENVSNSIMQLLHPNGYLSSIPENICDFENIVYLDLSFNKITNFDNITCLKNLSVINLSQNQLTKISFDNFNGLRQLHNVNLAHNNIIQLDPRTFADLGIQFLDMSYNDLRSVDFTNIFVPKSFCVMSYMNNSISNIINEQNIDVDRTRYNLGNGFMIDLRNNKMSLIPRPFAFGLRSYTEYGQIAFNRYSMRLHGNEIFCDCQIGKLLQATAYNTTVLAHIFNIDGTGNGFYCKYPKNLEGFSIEEDIIKKDRLDLLVCQLNSSECPRSCQCFFQPYFNRSVVNCTSAWDGLELPDFDLDMLMMNTNDGEPTHLELYFHGNKIEKLTNKPFLMNATKLDFSSNNLQYVSPLAILRLPRNSKLFLSNNVLLKNIPKTFENLNPWNINFTNISIDCDCSMFRWVSSWLKVHRINTTSYSLKCLVNGNRYSIADMGNYMYDCETEETYTLVIITSVLSFLVIFIFYLYRKYSMNAYVFYLRKRRVKDVKDSSFLSDVYISMLGNNDYLQNYIIRHFLPMLEEHGYNVYYPLRDSLVGYPKEELMLRNLQDSRNYVFFITSITDTFSESFEFLEWTRAWDKYREDFQRNIILINFDLVRASEVKDSRLRAYIVMGNYVDICDRNIYKKVLNFIGAPLVKLPKNCKIASKPKFNLRNLKPYHNFKSSVHGIENEI